MFRGDGAGLGMRRAAGSFERGFGNDEFGGPAELGGNDAGTRNYV